MGTIAPQCKLRLSLPQPKHEGSPQGNQIASQVLETVNSQTTVWSSLLAGHILTLLQGFLSGSKAHVNVLTLDWETQPLSSQQGLSGSNPSLPFNITFGLRFLSVSGRI